MGGGIEENRADSTAKKVRGGGVLLLEAFTKKEIDCKTLLAVKRNPAAKYLGREQPRECARKGEAEIKDDERTSKLAEGTCQSDKALHFPLTPYRPRKSVWNEKCTPTAPLRKRWHIANHKKVAKKRLLHSGNE